MRILANGVLRHSGGRVVAFEHPNQGDGPRIRTYMEGANGFSKFGLTEPAMGASAWSKVQTIGAYVFQKFYWTGTDQFAKPNGAYDTLVMVDNNQSQNGGKGPTWSCGTVSAMMQSILTSYGVQVMNVSGKTHSGSLVDVTLAAFIPEWNKWVWWHAPTAGYALLPDGTAASPLELYAYYTQNQQSQLTFKSGTATIQTNTGYDQYGVSPNESWWQTSGADIAYGGFFYECEYLLFETKYPILPANAPGHQYYQNGAFLSGLAAKTSTSIQGSANDLFPSVNSLQLVSAGQSYNRYTLKFEHNMVGFQSLQKSTDNAAWSNLRGLSDSVPVSGSGSIYYRVISDAGVVSNTVQLTY